MGNELFIFSAGDDCVALKIGSKRSARKIYLTDEGALTLAYRLMSVAKGGTTHGWEKAPALDRTIGKSPALAAPYGSKPDGSPKELEDLT